ncbi:MAG: hypothetical protein IJH75_03325 [Mogibacterium sp.]|nr:hypothetical protein [Mogibacterium sp.]
MSDLMNNMMGSVLGKVAPGMCRLSVKGSVAIKTGNGYKYYDADLGRLVNCDNFVFPLGEESFFVIPTNRVKKGDIILANGKPKYVLEAGKDRITALNFENAVVETILPERYVFMGNMYLYGKIVSMFGGSGATGKKGTGKVFKYMMLSQMLSGNGGCGGNSSQLGSILPLLLFSGKGGLDFDGLFEDMEEDEPEEDLL